MEEETGLTVVLKVVGPLTRSTAGGEKVDPDARAISDGLHWIWCWRAQVGRLRESTTNQGQGADDLERRRSYSLASLEEHLLTVVGWNLARALKKARGRFPSHLAEGIEAGLWEGLRLLRHLYEHWDEQRESFENDGPPKQMAARGFVEQFPDGRPWSIVYRQDDWYLGGVVPISQLTTGLALVEEALLKLEQERKDT